MVLVNRIKPHTSFRGSIESGICKMIIIGMGKINGASAFHGGYEMTDFGKVLPPAAQAVVDNSRFLFGLGLSRTLSTTLRMSRRSSAKT